MESVIRRRRCRKADLVEELRDGPMNDSILLVALASIKQDIADLCESDR